MSKFNIPPLNINLPLSAKYSLGDSVDSIDNLKHHSLIFSFEYSCFRSTPISLNYEKPHKNHYIDFLDFFKHLSNITINDLIQNGDVYHFHDININLKYFLKTFLQKQFKVENIRFSALPSIYQIAYPTDGHQPRLCGFFGSLGVFYVLWWDFNHLIHYDTAINFSSSFRENWFEDFLA